MPVPTKGRGFVLIDKKFGFLFSESGLASYKRITIKNRQIFSGRYIRDWIVMEFWGKSLNWIFVRLLYVFHKQSAEAVVGLLQAAQ